MLSNFVYNVCRCYGGIDSAGQCAEDFSVAYFFSDSFDGFFYEGVHVPVAGAAADIVYKVGKHFLSFFGVQNFWMSHNDYISKAAPGFEIIAHTDDCPVAAVANVEKNLYATLYQEVYSTNFLCKIKRRRRAGEKT